MTMPAIGPPPSVAEVVVFPAAAPAAVADVAGLAAVREGATVGWAEVEKVWKGARKGSLTAATVPSLACPRWAESHFWLQAFAEQQPRNGGLA